MRSRISRRARFARALLLVLVLVLATLPVTPAAADPEVTTVIFEYTGAPQLFTVPAGVTEVIIEAWGAQGHEGGNGGFAKGMFSVLAGQTLEVRVGGMGAQGTDGPENVGGYNGGGAGRSGGGGGASDVRWSPIPGVRATSLSDRKLVAGGGGGYTGGGAGGGAQGAPGDSQTHYVRTCGYSYGNYQCNYTANGWSAGAQGGTETAGGVGAAPHTYYDGTYSHTTLPGTPGSFGVGGDGANQFACCDDPWGGGGGGGWYGGGGGAAWYGSNMWTVYASSTGGGGGSSFVSPEASAPETQAGLNLGNGRVVISYTQSSPTQPPIPSELPPVGPLPVDPPGELPDVTPGEPDCTDPTMTYETYDVGGAGYTMYVTVGDSPTDVEVCSKVTNPSGHVMFEDGVTVPKDTDPTDYLPPFTPPSVDTNAPDGEAPGSECTNQVTQGGSASNRAYVRTGSNADGEPLVCVGYRAGGGQGHVRVTVH